MFDAQLLMAGSTVYSPWFPRQADNAIFVLDVVEVNNVTIKVEAFTKNLEDAGDGLDTNGPDISTSTTGRKTGDWNTSLPGNNLTFKELVRYKFTVTGEFGSWVLFRMLSPSWFDTVVA